VLGTLTWKQCGCMWTTRRCGRKPSSRNPHSWMAHVNLGNHQAENGRLDDAISHFRQALEINPNEADAHVSLGTALMQTGDPGRSALPVSSGPAINPNDEVAHVNLGLFCCKREEPQSDSRIFRSACNSNLPMPSPKNIWRGSWPLVRRPALREVQRRWIWPRQATL